MWVKRLHEVGRGDLAVAGGKAANLGEMARLGLPVPDGFILTAGASLRDGWEQAAITAYHTLGGGPVAVRSSATAEDLADASFAGQQETFLNVEGEEALLEAIRRCRASLWSDRAVDYRNRRGIEHSQVAMAVVVQRMVAAEAAGVLFTVDPVTGRRDQALVEAAPGLGEAVVAGQVTGDSYRILRTSPPEVVERTHKGSPVLSDAHLLELTRLGLQLEAHFGAPQDIEFAVAQGRIWLLQSRPITTLWAEPEALAPTPKLDFLQRSFLPQGRERCPVAPKPLDNIIFSRVAESICKTIRAAGYATRPEDEAELIGRVWRDIYISFPRTRPTLRILGLLGTIRETLSRDWNDWWERAVRPRILQACSPQPLEHLSDQALLDKADQIADLFRTVLLERMPSTNGIFAEPIIKAMVALAVGPRRAGRVTSDLMGGLATQTSRLNDELWMLSREATDERFNAFLDGYGHREGRAWYLSEPTWRHDPSQVRSLLQGLGAVDTRPPETGQAKYEAALALVERRLACIPGLLPRFRWWLEHFRALQAFRENNHFDMTRCLDALQAVAREWARRLIDRGLLTRPDDIYYLTHDEVKAWFLGKAPTPDEARHHIARRRATYQVVNSRWQAAMFAPTRPDTALKGVPSGAGTIRARARIVRSEAEWNRLQPGEIMVCPYTNPSWTPLFAIAAGVVTETGGAASHAAIVAREYGIPAVMGVPGATQRIADGQEILVDGNTGRISR